MQQSDMRIWLDTFAQPQDTVVRRLIVELDAKNSNIYLVVEFKRKSLLFFKDIDYKLVGGQIVVSNESANQSIIFKNELYIKQIQELSAPQNMYCIYYPLLVFQGQLYRV
ncbi:hypothetical protein ABPG72_002160 [Tetrahymena utriculariae]